MGAFFSVDSQSDTMGSISSMFLMSLMRKTNKASYDFSLEEKPAEEKEFERGGGSREERFGLYRHRAQGKHGEL